MKSPTPLLAAAWIVAVLHAGSVHGSYRGAHERRQQLQPSYGEPPEPPAITGMLKPGKPHHHRMTDTDDDEPWSAYTGDAELEVGCMGLSSAQQQLCLDCMVDTLKCVLPKFCGGCTGAVAGGATAYAVAPLSPVASGAVAAGVGSTVGSAAKDTVERTLHWLWPPRDAGGRVKPT